MSQSYKCPICGKGRGGGQPSHEKCSKLLQKQKESEPKRRRTPKSYAGRHLSEFLKAVEK